MFANTDFVRFPTGNNYGFRSDTRYKKILRTFRLLYCVRNLTIIADVQQLFAKKPPYIKTRVLQDKIRRYYYSSEFRFVCMFGLNFQHFQGLFINVENIFNRRLKMILTKSVNPVFEAINRANCTIRLSCIALFCQSAEF